MDKKSVMIMAQTDDAAALVKASEAFARCAAGLAMDDISVMMAFNNMDEQGNLLGPWDKPEGGG
jgi:hypothetical protein